MSAFIVSEQTFRTIVTAAFKRPHGGIHLYHEHDTRLGVPLFHELFERRTTPDHLHRALYDLNEEAFCQCYPGKNAERTRYPEALGFTPFETPVPTDPWQIERGALIRALKATKCLLYQCGEGGVPEYKLYKALEKFAGVLALDFAESSPEYEAAAWD
jgi:hypothetical protein